MIPMSPRTRFARANIAVALTLAAAAAGAAPTAAVEQLDTVAVQGTKRDPSLLAYGRLNELLIILQRYSEGLVRADFQIGPADKSKPLVNPRVTIETDERSFPIALDAEHRFHPPVLPPEQARNAELATNQPKGSVSLRVQLELTPTPEQLDMATVRRIVGVAHRLRSEGLPWYLRWAIPQVHGVRICSAAPQWELEWREQGQLLGLPLTADAKDRDPEAKRGEPGRPCTTLTGQEQWPDGARLVAPSGTKLSVRFVK